MKDYLKIERNLDHGISKNLGKKLQEGTQTTSIFAPELQADEESEEEEEDDSEEDEEVRVTLKKSIFRFRT